MGKMKKAALLFFATGPYIAFWKRYYDSFEKFFLPQWEKHYYVFTDQEDIYQAKAPNVHRIYQKHLPWPLITLLKYNIALEYEAELLEYDFVMQTNANVECCEIVTPDEILPNAEKGEHLGCIIHAGIWWNKKYYSNPCYYPYDRNPKSKAYIPYNWGQKYVFGAGVCGTGCEYVAFMHEIANRVTFDLQHNIIPKWHDESYVNHYVNTHEGIRYLHPGFCYPTGFAEIPYPRKIVGIPKESVFDIDNFKGVYIEEQKTSFLNKSFLLCRSIVNKRICPRLFRVRDYMLFRKPSE